MPLYITDFAHMDPSTDLGRILDSSLGGLAQGWLLTAPVWNHTTVNVLWELLILEECQIIFSNMGFHLDIMEKILEYK